MHDICISTHATCLLSVSIALCSLVIADRLGQFKLLFVLVLEADAVSMILWSTHRMLILNSSSTARFCSSTSMTSSIMNPNVTLVGNPEEWSGETLLTSVFCSLQLYAVLTYYPKKILPLVIIVGDGDEMCSFAHYHHNNQKQAWHKNQSQEHIGVTW